MFYCVNEYILSEYVDQPDAALYALTCASGTYILNVLLAPSNAIDDNAGHAVLSICMKSNAVQF